MSQDHSATSVLASLETMLEHLTHEFEGEILWWRGHGDATWELIPGAFREQVSGVTGQALVHHFKTRAAGRLGHRRLPSTELEWLLLAQHYGLPTQLLDWTENVLVALYFAVMDKSQDGLDACVWALSPSLMNMHLADPYKPGKAQRGLVDFEDRPIRGMAMRATGFGDDAIRRMVFTDHTSMPLLPGAVALLAPEADERIVAQSGRFTLHSTPKDLTTLQGAQGFLRKLAIPSNQKVRIRGLLSAMGMRRWNLFPDLSSLAAGLKAGGYSSII